MPHELPKAYEPGAIEKRWAEYWVREKLFHVETPDGSGQWPVVSGQKSTAQDARTEHGTEPTLAAPNAGVARMGHPPEVGHP
jgi:hypothetical protein